MTPPDVPPPPPRRRRRITLERPETRAAWRGRRAWLLLLIVFAAGLWVDLASKSWSFRTIAPAPVVLDRARLTSDPAHDPIDHRHSSRVILGGLMDLRLVLNPGAVLGVAPNQRGFFVAFTVLALLGGLLVFGRYTAYDNWLAHIAIALVLAGGIGNLYDRLFIGRVRDFLHLLPGRRLPFGWTWPGTSNPDLMPWVFNVADLLLFLGMLKLLINFNRRASEREAAEAEAEPVPVTE